MTGAEIHPGDPDPVELEWETFKWLTIDSLAMSVNEGLLERDKAIELAEHWFGSDRVIVAALYR